MHDQKLQYFGKNSPVCMEEIYGPERNNQYENTPDEHEKKINTSYQRDASDGMHHIYRTFA